MQKNIIKEKQTQYIDYIIFVRDDVGFSVEHGPQIHDALWLNWSPIVLYMFE